MQALTPLQTLRGTPVALRPLGPVCVFAIKAGVEPFLDRCQREKKRLLLSKGIPHTGRQGRSSPIDPGKNGAVGPLRATDWAWYAAVRSELLSFRKASTTTSSMRWI